MKTEEKLRLITLSAHVLVKAIEKIAAECDIDTDDTIVALEGRTLPLSVFMEGVAEITKEPIDKP